MRAAVLAVWACAGGAAAQPAGLTCLQTYYGVRPVSEGGAWKAVLPDGSTHPWDDGRVKSFEEMLDAPDLEDTFRQPYPTGPIQPVTQQDSDPGRVRYDPLFRAVYGRTAADVDLVDITFLGQALRVHRKARPAFARVEARLKELLAKEPRVRPFLQGVGGTFNWRNIAGTQRLSAHAFGVSLDINVRRSHYWQWQRPAAPLRWQNAIPQAVVDAFEAEGFIWGGRWYHYDTMHFEYRPELLDPKCRG